MYDGGLVRKENGDLVQLKALQVQGQAVSPSKNNRGRSRYFLTQLGGDYILVGHEVMYSILMNKVTAIYFVFAVGD
jgi:hypothetical protein